MKNKKTMTILISILFLGIVISVIYFTFFYKKEFVKVNDDSRNFEKEGINYFNSLLHGNLYEDDYYGKQLFELNERINSEKSLEAQDKNYQNTFYSDKQELLEIKPIDIGVSDIDFSEVLASMQLLNYYGIDVSFEGFTQSFIPENVFHSNQQFRPNPNESCLKFDEKTYSNCFAPILGNIVQHFFGEKQQIQSYVGMNLNYMISNIPAVIWVGKGYNEASDIYKWEMEANGRTYTYPKDSHAVLLVGYDKDNFYILDSQKSEDVIKVNRTTLAKSYDSYGRQAFGVFQGNTGLLK